MTQNCIDADSCMPSHFLLPFRRIYSNRRVSLGLKLLKSYSMSPIISEILKIKANSTFTLDSPAFSLLRETPIKFGVKEQYYGKCTDEPDTLLWVISVSDLSYLSTPADPPFDRLAQGRGSHRK